MSCFYLSSLLFVVVKISARRFDTTELENNANLQPRNDNENTNNQNCAGDFGKNLNDPVCCGQPGTIGSSDHICPKKYPICKGFIQGRQWGSCSNASVKKVVVKKHPSCAKQPDVVQLCKRNSAQECKTCT